MARLRVRWTDNPDDVPAEGEAIGRLAAISGSTYSETVPGGGLEAPGLAVDLNIGELRRTASHRTDLVTSHSRYEMVVSTADGRRLVARFGPDVASPQTDSDAPADLRDAMNRLWKARSDPGRPSRREERIEMIVAATLELGEAATRRHVAEQLGRVNRESLAESSDFKADVASAGGWEEIRRRAGL